MVKCLAQGHKRRDRPGRDSNPHSDSNALDRSAMSLPCARIAHVHGKPIPWQAHSMALYSKCALTQEYGNKISCSTRE